MTTRLLLALAVALCAMRLPSLVQPMGSDQALYAYVGDRLRAGDIPYRDAWDQKPPAIHFLYAGLRALWAGDAVVPAADLAAAMMLGWLLYRLGTQIGPRGTGATSALLFLLLSNPAFTRVAGVRLRSQCETFIAVAVTAAFLLLARSNTTRRSGALVGAGLLFGLAFTFKYNAVVFAVGGVIGLWLWKRGTIADPVKLTAGFLVPPLAMVVFFAIEGAARPLFDATILYNVRYSGETYAGPLDAVRYLLTFPVDRARVDALWTLGGAGCILLILGSIRDRERLVPVVWVAAACVSIAINGSRGLPQYFVQANPMLALAAGWGTAMAWAWMRSALGNTARYAAATAVIVVSIGVWRVNQFDKLLDQTVFDARFASGGMSRTRYLQRYDDDRKYSAVAAASLGEYFRAHSAPDDRVFLFGFTCAAYVEAGRPSASRFFWSRPVIVGFNAGQPGYGTEGLLADLERNRPAVIALQQRDWAPDVDDSARFFMATPSLAGWLQIHYEPASGPEGFDLWLRRSSRP
jgi:Dolichyl-phosphate-mannose-protein mannosyltransferase